MSISPLSQSYSAQQTNTVSSVRQDFGQLANALQSGNLQGAQRAFTKLEQLQSSQPSSAGSGPSGAGANGTSSNNPIANDIAALGQALTSGDLTQAQAAFTQLKTDIKAAPQSGSSGGATAIQGHHHRRHNGGNEDAAPST